MGIKEFFQRVKGLFNKNKRLTAAQNQQGVNIEDDQRTNANQYDSSYRTQAKPTMRFRESMRNENYRANCQNLSLEQLRIEYAKAIGIPYEFLTLPGIEDTLFCFDGFKAIQDFNSFNVAMNLGTGLTWENGDLIDSNGERRIRFKREPNGDFDVTYYGRPDNGGTWRS